MPNMNASDADHWSSYWAHGFLTSLPQDFSVNYDGAIAAFWELQFEAVPHAGRILDLCAGNGAIAIQAVQFSASHDRAFEVMGLDAARIDPEAVLDKFPDQAAWIGCIRFISETRLEDLQQPAESFDLLTSQYGIEYCDWVRSAEQAFHLLRPGGRLSMLTHETTSTIMEYMESEARDFALLEELRFLTTIREFLDGDRDFGQFREAMTRAHEQVLPAYQRTQAPLMATVLSMLNGVLGMDEWTLRQYQANLERFHGNVQHGLLRLQDMLRVNRAIQSNPDWFGVFERAGLQLIESGELLHREQHHAGRFYVFRKPE